TPVYLSPEQARNEPVEPRSDLYSVGVMLCEFLTGKRPFLCATPKDDEQAHGYRHAPTFAEVSVDDVPAAIEMVVRRCLAKHVSGRPRDAAELAQLYEAALRPTAPLPAGGSGTVRGVPSLAATTTNPQTSLPARYQLEVSMPARVAMFRLRGLLTTLGG